MSGLGTTALLRTADVPNICVVGADVLGDRNVRASLPNARAASARFGHSQAIVRRGEPVQFQL